MNQSLRVVAFTKTASIGPSSRYRYLQYRDLLRGEGVELVCRPLFGVTWFRLLRIRPRWLATLLKCGYVPLRFAVRLVQLIGLGAPDLVVIEHQLFPYLPAFAEAWLSARGQRWTVEFDDAIHLTRFHLSKMKSLVRQAARVIVGNSTLAAFAREHSKAVAIVPTTIPLSRYPLPAWPRSAVRAGPRVIGWIGLPYNFDALRILAEPLRQLAQEMPLLLRVVSSGDPHLAGVPVEVVEWSYATEIELLSSFDVGVMPLVDDPWSRGKCGLKILQYFAAGVPVVASPVGVNRDIIEHGVNGYLADDAAAWLVALRRLLAEPGQAAALAQAGRATVEQHYSAEVWAPRIAALWRETAITPCQGHDS